MGSPIWRSDSDQGHMLGCCPNHSPQIHVPSGGKIKKSRDHITHLPGSHPPGPHRTKFITKSRGKCQSPPSVNPFPFTPELCSALSSSARRRPRSFPSAPACLGASRRGRAQGVTDTPSFIPRSKLRVSIAVNLAKFGSVAVIFCRFRFSC